MIGLLLGLFVAVSGTVTYANGDAASRVKVTVQSGDSSRFVFTDQDGRYELLLPASVAHAQIKVQEAGCKIVTQNLTGQSVVNVRLLPEPPRGAIAGSVARVLGPPLSRQEPEYPPELQSKGIGGEVKLLVVVNRDGSVRRSELSDLQPTSIDPALLESARRAVLSWRYRPVYVNCTPMEVVVPATITFPPK